MHYTGMAAMRLAAHHHYHLGLWLLSVLLAVVISLAALWLTIHFREENRGRLFKSEYCRCARQGLQLQVLWILAAHGFLRPQTSGPF
jgi:NO-binding membrane sensor protein with MHYT domain